ncbi:1,2-phenylacetyl-CoA epoxidase subunit PaaC [Halobacteriales archaeon Cl-PHB]
MTPDPASLDREDLTPESQAALEELLFRLADDEFVHAERLTEWEIYAPTVESDLALANVAQDEFGHARLWYDLLEELGYSEPECIWERDPTDWTHSTLVERPFEEGDWGDVVVRSYLYDVAEELRLESIRETSYAPLADRVGKALAEEEYHREFDENWLERLVADEEAKGRLQHAVDARFPQALTLFDPGPRETAIREHGFRTESLSSLREEWFEEVIPTLESYDLLVPDVEVLAYPEYPGRFDEHSPAWPQLFDRFTETYREVDLGGDPIRLRSEEA